MIQDHNLQMTFICFTLCSSYNKWSATNSPLVFLLGMYILLGYLKQNKMGHFCEKKLVAQLSSVSISLNKTQFQKMRHDPIHFVFSKKQGEYCTIPTSQIIPKNILLENPNQFLTSRNIQTINFDYVIFLDICPPGP